MKRKTVVKSSYDYHRFEGKNEACYLVTGDGKWLAGPYASDDTYEFEDELMDVGKTYEELPEYHGEVNFDPDWGQFTTDDWSSYFKSLQSSKERTKGKNLTIKSEKTLGYDRVGYTRIAEKVLGVLDKEQFKSFGGDSHWEGVLVREALEELNEDSENDALVEKTTKEVHDMIYNSKRIRSARIVPGGGNYYIWMQRRGEPYPYWLSGDAMAAHQTEDLETAVVKEGLRPFSPDDIPYLVSDEGVPVSSKLYDENYNYVGTIQDVFPELMDRMRKSTIKSARGEVTDSNRALVRDILAQVPALVKVPTREQGIKKEPYGPDHVCYYYTEAGERPGSFVTVEFHVDPTDNYTEVYILTRASFAAAADGDEARQDEREVTLDQFTIEDLEDYSLSEVDRIDTAVQKGFDGAQQFDAKSLRASYSTKSSRAALFSSHKKH